MSQSSELDENELQQLEEDARPAATKRATVYGLRKFTAWLERRGRTCDFGIVSAQDLAELLRKFYAEVKPDKQGTPLTPSTLTCIRAAIHRHLTSAPHSRPFNIIKDREFVSANAMFTARCKLYFKAGHKKPQHKPPIGEGDMAKLGSYFANWRSNPDTLVEACWFHLCYNFGRRGREGWTKMLKSTFTVETDSEGFEYVTSKKTEVTKNHQGGYKQCDIDYSDQRMYGPGVAVFKFYMMKTNPECERLFQTALRAYREHGEWFKNEPMGKNTLGTMMQRISRKAGLSTVYTCHSVRASTITNLFHAGISTQEIISITKHKNTSSLNHYIQDITPAQKRDCSKVLTSALGIPHTQMPSCTVSRPPPDESSTSSNDVQDPTIDMSHNFLGPDYAEPVGPAGAPIAPATGAPGSCIAPAAPPATEALTAPASGAPIAPVAPAATGFRIAPATAATNARIDPEDGANEGHFDVELSELIWGEDMQQNDTHQLVARSVGLDTEMEVFDVPSQKPGAVYNLTLPAQGRGNASFMSGAVFNNCTFNF